MLEHIRRSQDFGLKALRNQQPMKHTQPPIKTKTIGGFHPLQTLQHCKNKLQANDIAREVGLRKLRAAQNEAEKLSVDLQHLNTVRAGIIAEVKALIPALKPFHSSCEAAGDIVEKA